MGVLINLPTTGRVLGTHVMPSVQSKTQILENIIIYDHYIIIIVNLHIQRLSAKTKSPAVGLIFIILTVIYFINILQVQVAKFIQGM